MPKKGCGEGAPLQAEKWRRGLGRLERLKIAVPVPVVCGKPVEIPEVDANFPEVRKGFCNYSGSTSGKQLLYIYIFIEYSGGTGGRMGNLYVCEETITLRRRVL
jgi:hypothetical protein